MEKQRVQQLPVLASKGYDAIFNAEYLTDIPAALSDWGCTRAILVVSKALDSETNVIVRLQERLGGKVIDVKRGVGQHSPYADVIDIAHRLQDSGADALVCVGSSSYSDACKIGRLLAATLPAGFGDDDMEGLIDQSRGLTKSDHSSPLQRPSVRLICVPTSLSASEWNPIASCTNKRGKKQHFGRWDFGQPDLILCDPLVASTAPKQLWLSSGVRVIDHCVETICNPGAWADDKEDAREHARKGLRAILSGLRDYHIAKEAASNPPTHQDQADHLLRGISACQVGSREAMMAFLLYRIPFGPSHAIGHQLGSVGHVLHGITSCVMLAPVLRYSLAHPTDANRSTIVQAQQVVLDVFNQTLGWHEVSAGSAVQRFVRMLGMPDSLKAVGVTEKAQIQEIAEKTMTDVWGGSGPQLDYDAVLAIVTSARG